jgi:hypothetical protein
VGKPPKRYESPPDYHRHRCDRCGNVWEHHDDNAGVDAAHVCPQCGNDWQTTRYYGVRPPSPPMPALPLLDGAGI